MVSTLELDMWDFAKTLTVSFSQNAKPQQSL